MIEVLFSNIKLYFMHYILLVVLLAAIYSFYLDFYKVRREGEIPSDADLMERFIHATRKGLIK